MHKKKRRSIFPKLFFFFVPWFIYSCGPQAADFEFQDIEPLPVEDMRVQIYTQEFADRFSLPDSGVSAELEGGIEALDFLVQKNFRPSADYYIPLLRVYLTEETPIAYPAEKPSGNRFDHEMSSHFFSDRNLVNWPNPDDVNFFTAPQQEYYLAAFIASADYVFNERGFRASLPINRYERDIVSGISFLELGYSNIAPEYADESESRDIVIWLRRLGAPAARTSADLQSKDFLKIPIPAMFVTQIMPHARASYQNYQELVNRRKN